MLCNGATIMLLLAMGANAKSLRGVSGERKLQVTLAPTVAPTAAPTPMPTCGCQAIGEVCKTDSINGAFTCCGGSRCSAEEGSGEEGVCVDVPPPPKFLWQIPGTVQAGGYNAYTDVADPNNILGPRVGNGSEIGFINAGESATYNVNVTETRLYGVRYLLEAAGDQDEPIPVKIHMRADTECNSTEGRLGEINIENFNAPDGEISYGAGDVELPTSLTNLTVCFEQAGFTQVNGYVFGDEGSGFSTPAPTAAPTAAPVAPETPTPTEPAVETAAPSAAEDDPVDTSAPVGI